MIETIKRMVCWLKTRHIYEIQEKIATKQCLGCTELRDGYDNNYYQL